jgi:hypothetical protein
MGQVLDRLSRKRNNRARLIIGDMKQKSRSRNHDGWGILEALDSTSIAAGPSGFMLSVCLLRHSFGFV